VTNVHFELAKALDAQEVTLTLTLTLTLTPTLALALTPRHNTAKAALGLSKDEWTDVPDLYQLVTDLMWEATACSVFGDALGGTNPINLTL